MYMRRDTLEQEGWKYLCGGRARKIIAEIQLELVHLSLPPIPVARATDRTTRPWVPPWVDYFFAYAQGAGHGGKYRRVVPSGTLVAMVVAYQANHPEIRDAMDAAMVSATVSSNMDPAMRVFDEYSEMAREYHQDTAEALRQVAMKEIRAARRATR